MSTINVKINGLDVEVLLDSGSSFSSISSTLANTIKARSQHVQEISVIFGDKKHVYNTSKVLHLPFGVHGQCFQHPCYILPRQIFQVTLGCDWLMKHGAHLNFKNLSLDLPSKLQLPFLPLGSLQNLQNVQNKGSLSVEECHQGEIQELLRKFQHLLSEDGVFSTTTALL